MITHLPYVGFIPAPVPIPQPPTPSYAGLSEFDRLYVPRPAEPTDADRMIAALRRIAKAAWFEDGEKERVLADNNRLEDENASLRGELLWWQKEHGFRRMNGEFGTIPEEAATS